VRRDSDPPTALVDAVRTALRDLTTPDDEVKIGYYLSDAGPAARMVVMDYPDGERSGFEVVTSDPGAVLLAATADGLQQGLIDRFREARPVCPDHTHPPSATVEGATAVWSCPVTDRAWPIGVLGRPGVRSGDREL